MSLPALDLPRVDTGGFGFGAARPKARTHLAAALGWRGWLEAIFPSYVSRGFAPHHEEFWGWVWGIGPDTDPAPFLAVWSRGGGKSSSAELAAAALGIRGKRSYVLYARDTQERADDSVSNIAVLLESAGVERDVDRYGNSRGWRRNRILAEGGFTVDALGLDVAGRGVKLEDRRPDVIIFDDIDGRHDSTKITDKNQATITDSLLPAGTDNVAILFIQNLIIPDGAYVAAGVAPGHARELPARVREDFVDPAQWRVFPDVFPALDGLSSRGWTHLVLSNHVPELSSIDGGSGSASSASSIPPKSATRSRTRRRTVGSCAPWATRSRRYGVSSAPVGRRSEYRNFASATAIKKIRRNCHKRSPAGVSMSKPRDTLEETWPATPGSRRPN